MNGARELPRRDYEALKDATKDLVERSGGPKGAAEITRCDAARLSRYGNKHEEGMFAPIDVIADMEARLGAPVVTAILADLMGLVLVPKGEAKTQSDLTMHVGTVAKETGEAVCAVAELVAGPSPQKIARARKELREAHEAIAGAESHLDRVENVTPIRRGTAS